jgi:hypothetical protein
MIFFVSILMVILLGDLNLIAESFKYDIIGLIMYKNNLELDNSVGIAGGYGLDGPGSSPGRGKIFLFSTASRPTLGAHPASYPMGSRGSFLRGKAAGV